MQHILRFLLLSSFFTGSLLSTVSAQSDLPRGSAKLTGIIVDSVSKKPVEFASVALIDLQTTRPIDGAVADEKGQFTISKMPEGSFRLRISFIGYRDKIVRGVKINRRDDVNLGTILLVSDTKTLQEVEVVGQKAMIEEKVDRIIYNADKDIMSKGGDATEVMRKVPLLTVDLDGNVSLRGNSNVRVLINNKPSTIVASSVADALKQIPADQIKTVEVITSPSAKYDAEGSAGIINITTKKNSIQGYSLNVDSGVGNRGTNLGLNGTLRTGKMGFSLGGFGRANYNVRGRFENTQTLAESGRVTQQSAETRNNGVFGQYRLGWDYDFSETSNLSANLRYGLRNNFQYQDNFLTQTLGGAVPSNNLRNVKTEDLSGTVDANLDYTKRYKTTGDQAQKEMSFSAQYSRNNRNNNFIADLLNYTNPGTLLGRQQNLNDSFNQEITLQADYQTPVGKRQLIEFGGKGILRQVESQFGYNIASGTSPLVKDPNRLNNTLNYDQDITAAYISYTLTTKSKYSIKAGTRFERTTINANFSQDQPGEGGAAAGKRLPIPNYNNLVPSINISKTLKGGKTIKLAYNRRLQRPGIQFLNPNVNAANPASITQGNPLLAPELTDNFEFSSSAYVKSIYINGSLFYRNTSNSITSVRTTDTTGLGQIIDPALPLPIITTFENIGREQAYGLNLFGNATLFSKWQIGGGIDTYYAYLTNNSPLPSLNATNSGWVTSGRLFTSLTLKNGWGAQGFAFARGRQVQLQGYQGGFAFYSLGVKKDFKNKRGSIGLAGENFFNHPFIIRSEASSPIFTQNGKTSLFNAGIRVNFSYKIGKLSFEDQPRKQGKSINNDDVKGGDGGGDAGGGQPAAPTGGGGRRPR